MDATSIRPSEKFDTQHWTTNAGVPVYNNMDSLTVGRRGPVLLEDYHLIEKISQFDRERIPERVVHARGAGAKGYFEVTSSEIQKYSCADLFREVGVQTPLITRFSTVVHERGSPESVRDVRGFSVKFYTREGNWDFVGNNIPVFFIRDGIQFPDLIHAFKPNPYNNQQEFWRIYDYLQYHPESLNVLTYLMGDDGIPLNYRHMSGFSVNTFKFINKDHQEFLVKLIWNPKQTNKYLMDDEAAKVQGGSDRHATADLYDSIEKGQYPEWQLTFQVMNVEDEDNFDFDPLDCTKEWPEELFPQIEIGKMVLNKNVDHFFQDTEMLAFNPGIIVPGIYYSNDKMLQSRVYSYSDSQRHRIGANYLQTPVNMPKCQYKNNHYDGPMNWMHREKEVNYFPSGTEKYTHAKEWPIASEKIEGKREKLVIEKQNDFYQPGERFRKVFTKEQQERFIERQVGKLGGEKVPIPLRHKWVELWTKVDSNLGSAIQQELNKMKCL